MPHKRCKTFLDKLPDDEPAFTVRARDPIILDVIETWLRNAKALGVNQAKLTHVEAIRDHEIIPYLKTHATKVPD